MSNIYLVNSLSMSPSLVAGQYITGTVDTFAQLPDATTHANELWLVNQTTGVIFVNQKEKGFYKSNATIWEYKGYFPSSATQISNAPTGNISATNVQSAINELDSEKQPLITSATNLDVNSIKFNTTPSVPTPVEGQTFYDSTTKSLATVVNGGSTLNHGLEVWTGIQNSTGVQIEDMRVVAFDGAVGASGKVKGKLGVLDGSYSPRNILGVSTQHIPNGEEAGKVTVIGDVNNVNTTGSLFGETWAVDDILYVSNTVPGALTKVKPNAPLEAMPIAKVSRVNATTGILTVKATDFPIKLEDLSNVNGTVAQAGYVLKYNGTAWDPSPLSLSPAGADTQIQFNDGGVFGATSDFTYNKTTKINTIKASTDSCGYKVITQMAGAFDAARMVDVGGNGRVELRDNGGSLVVRISGGANNYILGQNVGFGLTGPQSKVHIDGGASTATYSQWTQGATSGQTATDGLRIGLDASLNAVINNQENTALKIYTNATQRGDISNAGVWKFGDIGGGNYSSFEADGTMVAVGNATTWRDIDFPIIVRSTGAGIPSLTAVTGNLTAPQWQVNDLNMCEAQEFVHSWKEGSAVYFHIHLITNGLDATNRYVNFEVEYAWMNPNGVVTAATTTASGDLLIPANTTDKTMMIMSLFNFTPTGGKIGGHILARLKRIASVGTAPTNNPWVPMLQLHIEQDTEGSRSIATK